MEDLIPVTNTVIAMTKLGYIKRMSADNFRAQHRGGRGIKGMETIDDDYIEEKTTVFCNLSDEANQKMQTLWTDMKSSEEQTPNKVIVPAFMSVCVIASLIILIRRYIKKKKDMF